MNHKQSTIESKTIKLYVPGRLGILGEISDLVSPYLANNSDLIPGHAIAVTMDKGIYSTVKKSEMLVFQYSPYYIKTSISKTNLKKLAKSDMFCSYVCGTVLYIINNYDVRGIDIKINKMDLLIQKGLSSSAAICITVAKAYNELYNLNLTDSDIEKIAYEGEHLAKSKCGYLDQRSIMNNDICHLIFKQNCVESIPISVKKDVNILIVDLNQKKDTKKIMDFFNNALRHKKNFNNKLVYEILGEKNKFFIEAAINSLENGNLENFGKILTDYQKSIDKLGEYCDELKAPTLHKLFSDTKINKLTYGYKGVGSGGDGSALLICKGKATQEELLKYIKKTYNMNSIKFCIKSR